MKKNPITEPFKFTISSILTPINLIVKQKPTKIIL